MSPSLTAGFSDTLVGSDCYPSHIFNNYLGYLTEQAITLLSHMTCVNVLGFIISLQQRKQMVNTLTIIQ